MMAFNQPLPDGYRPSDDGSHAVFTEPIEASMNDDRSYKLILLPNEMEILLVHDANTDKSAAAMDVHVGNLTDPDNLQGLAHFLEHLLFMGTAKYPQENGYKEFLARHAGSSNASTFLDNTSFHFEVGHEHLEGALDRFSQFFVSPAFSENCKDREIRAIDSEFKRNLNADARRLFVLGKHLCSRDHPYWHFSTGNLITLEENPAKEKVDVRAELIAFYHKYYSANIMKLTIIGRDTLDQLTEWAVEKFSSVRNLAISPPAYPNPPWTSKELLTTVFMCPIQDTRSLEIKFPFVDEFPHYRVKPSNYINHLLGHKGEGSILSLLKRLGWANGLSMATMPAGIGHQFLKMTVDLTKEGLARHEDIVMVVFQYIKLMRQSGIQDYIWDEMVSLAALAYRFKEKGKAAAYAHAISRQMQHVDQPQWYLSGPELIRGRDDKLVTDCINDLRIDNWRGLVMTQDTSVIPGGNFTETEGWYGIKHHVANTSPELLQRLSSIELHPDLHLPEPNVFIPRNFETHKPPTDSPLPSTNHPNLIQHTPLVRLWHKKDDVFWVPKVNIYIQLKSPTVYASPLNAIKAKLVRDLLDDVLTERLYGAKLAGLVYNLKVTPEGLLLIVSGYHDKADLLIEQVIRALKGFNATSDPDRFSRVKERVERQYRNMDKVNPLEHAEYYLRYLIKETMWSYLEELEELQSITAEDCDIFAREMLMRLFIEGLIHGNISQDQALKVYRAVEELLSPRLLSNTEKTLMKRARILPEGCQAVYPLVNLDPDNVNSGIHYYLQVGSCSSYRRDATARETRALVMVVAQILQEPCFNQLRTKEQLGYVVRSGAREEAGVLGVTISIQSERDPVYLEHRIEALYRERIQNMLDNMSEDDLKKQIESAAVKKLETSKNLGEESTKYWKTITSGFYEFGQTQADVDEMRKVSLETLRGFFTTRILPDSNLVKKLSVHIRSQKLPSPVDNDGVLSGLSESTQDGIERAVGPTRLRDRTILITDETEFKANLGLSKAPFPVVDLLRYSKL